MYKRWRFDKSAFWESNLWQMYVCHVCSDVCGVCGEKPQVGHGEIKLICRFKSISIHPPFPCCPPLWVFQIRTVRRRIVGSAYAWILWSLDSCHTWLSFSFHRHVRWLLLNNPSCLRVMMYRHIVVLHPHFGTFCPLESPGMILEHLVFLAGLLLSGFFFGVTRT